MLFIFSSPPFYTNHVKLPNEHDPIPPEILNNPKFHDYFKDALGALDGSQIIFAPFAYLHEQYWNRKGYISQNCLFACRFSLQFCYALTGWEGSATDACIWDDAINHDFMVPKGKYYLADAGFPACEQLLLPYRGVCYHLAEWGCANIRYVIYFNFLTINLI